MKFNVTTVTSSGCRLGVLSHFAQSAEKPISTPTCMVYTRGGCVPYLTSDVLKYIPNLPALAQMPLPMLSEHTEIIANFKHGIKKFAVMQDKVVHSCVQDPAQTIPSGYNDKHGVSVWNKSGRLKLDAESFMALQEALQPDMYEVIADSDTPIDASRKRLSKSIDRSLRFLDQCLEKHAVSECLRNSAVLAVAGGGHDEKERMRSACEIVKRPVQGFCIGGFQPSGTKTKTFDFSQVKHLAAITNRELPDDKPRFFHGALAPDSVLLALETGIDVLDSSYPYLLTEEAEALVFCYHLSPPGGNGDSIITKSKQFTMKLLDERCASDVGPLLPGCTCHTCRTHSLAYVHHLFNTKELLANILLMIHNLHHYFGFFTAIQNSLGAGNYEDFRKLIISQNTQENVNMV